MKPFIVSQVRDQKGQPVKEALPQVKRRVVSPATARMLTTIMEGVVTNGTGTKAAIPGFRAAGKTGTAQKVDPRTGAYSSALSIGSFVGFVPADAPRLAMIVVIDEPQGEAWGGIVAAPVFRRVGEQVLTYMGVPRDDQVKIAMATR
jgi:cell division protein FtsI (penicillin-binding protein 3)